MFFTFSEPISDPLLTIAIAALAILAAPLAMRLVRIPGIIGILLAGAVLGPNGINLLERDKTMTLLGTVGLLYLLYLAGLSLDLNQFYKLRNRSITFGAISYAAPAMLALVIGVWGLETGLYASLLLGAIAGSHTLLAYPVAKNLGITNNRAVITVTGGTLVTDALALSVLAGVAGAATGDIGLAFWAAFVAKVGGFALIVVFGLPLVGRWFFRHIDDQQAQYVFLMVVLLVCAYLSKLVGLAPIVGGFLAGLVMNHLVPDHGSLMSRAAFIGESLFIPFFLLSVGMMVDFSCIFGSWEVWRYLASLLVMVVIGKGLAAKLAQRLFSHTPAEGWTMAGLTIPQAASTLAVTLIGFELKLFDTVVINAVVLLILVTCLIGPWMVDRFGRRIALAEERRPYGPAEAPRRIAIPLANPRAAGALMDLGFLLRVRNDPQPMYPLTIVPESHDVEAKVAASERLLGYAVIHAASADVPVHPVTHVAESIVQGMQRAFRELRIFTGIIGWDGKVSSRRHVFGDLLDPLIRDTSQQILICHFTQPMNTLSRMILLIPVFADREPGFDEAIQTLKRVASQLGMGMVVMATSGMIQRNDKRLRQIKPEVTLTFRPISSVAAGPAVIEGGITRNDLIVLLSARQGRISWQPALAWLPRRIRRECPTTSLIVLYPYESAADPATLGPASIQVDPKPWPLLDNTRITLHIEEQPIRDILRTMLQRSFSQHPDVMEEVLDLLIRSHNEVPIEVTAGVVLLHAHVPCVAQCRVYMATFPKGQIVESISQPVRVLFVLLSPRDLPPKRHLENLAGIAQMVHDPAVARQLAEAKDLGDIDRLRYACAASPHDTEPDA